MSASGAERSGRRIEIRLPGVRGRLRERDTFDGEAPEGKADAHTVRAMAGARIGGVLFAPARRTVGGGILFLGGS